MKFYHSFLSLVVVGLMTTVGSVAQETGSAGDGDSAPAASSSTESSFSDLSATAGDAAPAAPESAVVEAEDGSDSSGFFFPGGFGYLPETVSSLGSFDLAPPIDFKLSLEQGYNDNVYSRSTANGGRKGSWLSRLMLGTNILLSDSRTFLNLSLSVGGKYYWNIDRQSVRPQGRIALAHAFKISPRMTLTNRLSGGYYDQPDLSRTGVPNRANSGDYLDLDSHTALSYRWTPRFSTVTSFGASTIIYQDSDWRGSDYVSLIFGQSFNFHLAPTVTTVLDTRFRMTGYDDSNRNSTTEYLLAGVDFKLSPRLTGSARAGAEFRQYRAAGASDGVSPMAELAFGYRFGQGSHLQWFNRFGYEEGIASTQKNQSFRTGLQISHVITPRISTRLGGSYSHQTITNFPSNNSYDQHLITGNIGLDFAVNRSLKIFTTYRLTAVIYDTDASDYHRNEISIGAVLRF